MARYTGSKNKLARKIGVDLGLKSNPLKVARRLNIRPGQHGKALRRKVSDYGVQLQAKQRACFTYGIQEKQLRRLYQEATKTPSNTGTALLRLLELRLDNVVYRAGFAPTRAAARQLVSHGHVTVNNRKMDVSSYSTKVEDVVQLKQKSIKIPIVAEALKNGDKSAPGWIKIAGAAAQVSRIPEREEIGEGIDEQLIVEWYSR